MRPAPGAAGSPRDESGTRHGARRPGPKPRRRAPPRERRPVHAGPVSAAAAGYSAGVDATRLSLRERFILKDIERRLRRDPRLRHRMRAGRGVRSFWLPPTVTLSGAASLLLLVVGIRTSDPGVIRAFAGLWPQTLIQGFRLLRRWTEPQHVPPPPLR